MLHVLWERDDQLCACRSCDGAFGNEFLQVLRLIAQSAHEDDKPPPPPADHPVADNDYLRCFYRTFAVFQTWLSMIRCLAPSRLAR
ncbi:hypothetical protein L1887_21249 [Cichorium endivia]|nr:hypothetical protein L1887_21249 [Cichorium endivia]